MNAAETIIEEQPEIVVTKAMRQVVQEEIACINMMTDDYAKAAAEVLKVAVQDHFPVSCPPSRQ